ncbi:MULTISPECIES: single-stranded-DNA-specific exonuclease RecJ [unclassified Leeuwenhoekiella]|uniref:single-stranded-DNA-specific exonuclease RecJ n=1 Tax=unclassified Leeuwenhoekiella TaxID=2615029 RepID=UPI000C59C764|nr:MULTISPECIES: single-stranded-DNA-specific exonuclease RecJ [unclassified Leeuwenhoekiella]MAW95936.1 single-stranded-DNA-specific exonuclease RecJ [Leeuwenhoekiella sp.]MBA79930.1 single-stranded-DNA-specific exonuclease RecJ [Leeuwenhoekiella sp.]|tara:strand:+ start:14938 stop:16632 length:1695 start_codon:yes stop_codon:yes gene_type:complete
MRWTLKPTPEVEKLNDFANQLKVPEKIALLLLQRGIDTYEKAKTFFRPSLDDLHDPFLMKDMDRAVARINLAMQQGENILVYGDYDVDGTTSVALMSSYLLSHYPQVATYIPDRYKEGYGVSYAGIDYAHDNDISLIIALDCGVKAVEKVAYAKKLGIDFIICDHHRPGPEIPDAAAVLDPKREDCTYPYDELCGCGVGFKLIQALEQEKGLPVKTLVPYLDLVATAIGADIVPITGENRVLAFFGLDVINTLPRTGIQALIENVKKEILTITDVVFIIAPRINAAGRIKHGLHAVELLTEQNKEQAQQMAAAIEAFNAERKDLDKTITAEALEQIKHNQEEQRKTTVVYQENWHKGVIGIVASRLTETYYRPTLVFTKSGEKLAASARSVKGFDVYEALEACSEHIEQFGGHKYAAGLTLGEHQYDDFKSKFEEVVNETIDERLLIPEISIDAELNLEDITPKFYRILRQFAPFGPGNMTPVFMSKNLIDTGYGKCVGADDLHLKCTVTQPGTNTQIGAIGFNLGEKCKLITHKKRFKAAYSLDLNEWNGTVSIQLKLRDIQE